ncbi:iron chelate uptake ABC transporter family permease subunit [Gordonia humi]|uniref:Iron complex transport system permease protein n=2 Tax=Gordonia humi TaxID=686429 RepID=A0A840F510_9ACTN|nr:iron chelate uptake ABC transporter family permease subunit [Gordonia humi]MBB4134627.1 iron complex transport system permease protein [Gordonia humi]
MVSRNSARAALWLLGCGVLAVLSLVSLTVGAEWVPLPTAWDALTHYDSSVVGQAIVVDQRIPRTVLALLVGVALAVAGALMQALTRNPLADPGILGVNNGAALAVTIAIGGLGLSDVSAYIWFAFLGAVLAAVGVYLLGSVGRGGGTPVRLTLAGVALSAVLMGVTTGLMLLDPVAFNGLRAWNTGSLLGRPIGVAATVAPFILAGLLLSAVVARALNSVSLGDDLARSLGTDVGRTRAVSVVAITLLCGAAVAAAGPIAFVGLMVPHIARWIVGPQQPWIIAFALIGGPLLVLSADMVGRVIMPGEMAVGLVTAFVGAPVLIALVRRRKVSGL